MTPAQVPRAIAFHVAAVALVDAAGRLVTVRKRGTHHFMLPGGKIEPGENPADAAVRECREELGIELLASAIVPVGDFVERAANEPGLWIRGTIFRHPAPAILEARAEIEEVRWLSPHDPLPDDLAPLLANHVVPALGLLIRRE